MNPEYRRIEETRDNNVAWRKWGPYLSERQWGTVREDYSENGNAWEYFTHDQARSRAYRWGEDGLAGFSDEKQRLCFGIALWNGVDPILKERLFGLTNREGNHGEDVKEYYFYLDSTPTHSWMRYLYKYPQRPYPYDDLVDSNARRSRNEFEYELIDTGVFDDDRYFDIFVEYAKEGPEDILIRITAFNRGPEAAPLHLLPTVWFRNVWAMFTKMQRPAFNKLPGAACILHAAHPAIGERYLIAEGDGQLLFTDNETNQERVFGKPNPTPFQKDGINDYIVHGRKDAVNPAETGTKAAIHYKMNIPAGKSQTVRLRLTDRKPSPIQASTHDASMDKRRDEADQFFQTLLPPTASADERHVLRQAIAGLMWTKQYYWFDLDKWLEEHGVDPMQAANREMRNRDWFHMINDDVISMPDKWEYPWYAAWDLAFHCVALSTVDPDFAKHQLDMMLRELYLHPNGQIPAYEWNFGDVNPPVHAFATWYVYQGEKNRTGVGDLEFLKHAFNKLMLNFTWWVNRKDRTGKNIFEGGFLGLDNIGVFDRSAPLPTGGHLEQADGTAWMALFSQNMLQIALELAEQDSMYEDMAVKFVEHFMWIATAINRMGDHKEKMWDEEDGFFYDLLRLPDGSARRLKVRSLVGLLPLCAATIFPGNLEEKYPGMMERIRSRLERNPDLKRMIPFVSQPGVEGRHILSILDESRLRRVLTKLFDENEFFSPHGIRSISRYHAEHPYVVHVHGQEYRVDYLPAESDSGMFGGNSNWRGPIWLPVNVLIFRSLMNYYLYFGDKFRIEVPTGSGKMMTLFEAAHELIRRISSIFLKDEEGRRPVFGGAKKFKDDPLWNDHVLFYEYFHGDNGAGLGASHQTGWTGLIAPLIQLFNVLKPEDYLRDGLRSWKGEEAVK